MAMTTTAQGSVDALKLFADGLALVYHEARNVRHLAEKGYVPSAQWAKVVSSLSKDRVEAWRQLQPARKAAGRSRTARDAARLFTKRFSNTLDDLVLLYENPNWKHAKAWGGHAWRRVTADVAKLGRAIDEGGPGEVAVTRGKLLRACHNNGPLRDKIVGLDSAIGAETLARLPRLKRRALDHT